MSNRMTKRWFFVWAVAAAALVAGCAFSSNIRLHNGTDQVLRPYPVKTDPPPPHREGDPAGDLPTNGNASIDPHGFNPVYYASGITDPGKANGVYIGMQLDEVPYMIQYKVFHYVVEPGQAGKDPAKQPILLHSGVEEVENVDQKIVVNSVFPIGTPKPPGGWRVEIKPD